MRNVPHLALQGVSKEFVLRGKAMYRTLLVGVGLSEGDLIYNLELSGRLVPENNQFGWVLNMLGMMPSVRTE